VVGGGLHFREGTEQTGELKGGGGEKLSGRFRKKFLSSIKSYRRRESWEGKGEGEAAKTRDPEG